MTAYTKVLPLVCGVALGLYAIFVDHLANVGLLVAAIGLLFIQRVMRAPWR